MNFFLFYQFNVLIRRFFIGFILLLFLSVNLIPAYASTQAENLQLPIPGRLVPLSPAYVPALLKGIKVDTRRPFSFDFIMDTGNSDPDSSGVKAEAEKQIRYFLASLTVPEQDMWVNLSPYEKDRIIPEPFSVTDMGRDLLAQDYILKQITATLIYPESASGKVFWDKVYRQAFELYGTTDIPYDTFNKVWIVPEKAAVYVEGANVIVTKARLKVMLDGDYLAESKQASNNSPDQANKSSDLKSLLKDLIIPLLEQEVNEGKNFAPLRQIYHALILAKWYKETLKDNVLNKSYSDQNKVSGIDRVDKDEKAQIYNKYLEAFRKGAFNYIKDEIDLNTSQVLPRKYFSGGVNLMLPAVDRDSSMSLNIPWQSGQLWEVRGHWQDRGFDPRERLAADSAPISDYVANFETFDPDEDASQAVFASNTDRLIRQIKRGEHLAAIVKKCIEVKYNLARSYLFNPHKASQASEYISVGDVRDILNQLRHADVLRNILGVDNGYLVTYIRTTRNGLGIKDLNTRPDFGDEKNNDLISKMRQKLLTELDRTLNIVYSTYKVTMFNTVGSTQERFLELVNQLSTVRDTAIAIAADILEEAGISAKDGLGNSLVPLDIGIARIPDQDDGLPGTRQIIANIRAGMAVSLRNFGYSPTNLYDDRAFWDAVRKQGAYRLELIQNTEVFESSPGQGDSQFYNLKSEIKDILRNNLAWEDATVPSAIWEMIQTQQLFFTLKQYYANLNILDSIKQWSLDHNAALQRTQQINAIMDGLDARIRASDDDDELTLDIPLSDLIIEAWKYISQNPKLPVTDSDVGFYRNALSSGSQNIGLIAFDVKKMNNQNISTIEKAFQELESAGQNNTGEINRILMSIADPVTHRFFQMVLKVKAFLKRNEVKIKAIRVGGDELILVVEDASKISNLLLWDLQVETEGMFRVCATTVEAYVNSASGRSTRAKSKEKQIQAFARAMIGMEDVMRVVKRSLNKNGVEVVIVQQADGTLKITNAQDEDVAVDDAQIFKPAIDGGIDLQPSQINLDKQGHLNDLDWETEDNDQAVQIDSLIPIITGIHTVQDFPEFIHQSTNTFAP